MTILAGYVRKKGRFPDEYIVEKTRDFSFLTNDDVKQYHIKVSRIQNGHIIVKYKPEHPMFQDLMEDKSNNILAVLGFVRVPENLRKSGNLFDQCVQTSSKIIEDCEGEFVAVFADGKSGAIHIINDRFASRPFYIYKTENCLYFSSSLTFLICLVPERVRFDIIGWLQIFSYGSTIGKRTNFVDIQRVAPASHVTISRYKVEISQYYKHEDVFTEITNSEKYADEVFDWFKKGVEYRTKLAGKSILALSGGLDSRLIAGCLKRKNMHAFTFSDSIGDKNTIEVETARQVSRIMGIEHHIEVIPKAYASSVAKEVILLTGGLRGMNHLVKIMMYIDYIKNNGFNCLLGGGPGDVIAGSFVPKSLECISKNHIKDGILSFYDKFTRHGAYIDSLKYIFNKNVLVEYKKDLVQSFFNSFENINGTTAAHIITKWALLNRHPAFTFTTPIHNHPDVAEAFCHLDYKFSERMLRMPSEWLYDKNFYKYMIYKEIIELRDVVYANTGQKLNDRLIEYRYVSPPKTNTVIDNIKKKIKKNNFSMNSYATVKKSIDYFTAKNKNTTSEPSYLYKIFQNDEKLLSEIIETVETVVDIKNLVDVKKCRRFLKMIQNGKLVTNDFNGDLKLLGSLATFCYSGRYILTK